MGYLRFLIPFLLFFQVGCMRHYRSSHLSVSTHNDRHSGDGLGVHTRSVDGLSIHTRPVRRQLHQGAPLELPCTIIGQGFDPFLNPIVWNKVVGKQEIPMNTGAVVLHPFISTERYRIKYTMKQSPEPSVSVTLNINAVTLAESGVYRCELLSPDRILGNVTHTITVVAPVDSLTLSSNNTQPIRDGDNTTRHQMTFDFVENTPSYLACVAKGGHPKPTLKIYREKIDISEEFKLDISDVTTGEAGLQVTSYTVSLTNLDYRAPVTSRGQHLRCVAKIHKAQDLKRTKTALIEVKYGPRFECDASPRAYPGDQNVTLTCRVGANPPVTVDSVRWRFSLPTGENNTMEKMTLGARANVAGDIYTATAKLDDEGEMVVTLVIRNVTTDSFNTYRIEAANYVDSGHAEVIFAEAFTTAEPTTVELTTEKVTTRAPKDTILPENDVEKPAAAVTGGATENRMCTLLVLGLSLLIIATTTESWF